MKHRIKFLTLPDYSGTVANIFVHGYSAGQDLGDRRELSESVPPSLRGCTNIFAFWSSSHLGRIDSLTTYTLMGIARVNPYAVPFAMVGDRGIHYARIRSRADGVGGSFFDQMRRYLIQNHPHITHVNLIGHSLGGRVVMSALQTLEPSSRRQIEVDHVLIMAGAVEASSGEAARIKERIKGRLINAYSSSDYALLMNLGERSLGRREVANFDNFEMTGFGHRDYWPNLNQVLRRTRFADFHGQEVGSPTGKSNSDSVRADTDLYAVMQLAPGELVNEAVKHLKASSWVSIPDDEADRAYSLTREFQLLGGHFLFNLARRGRGISYAKVLDMLARHYKLGSRLHHVARIVELESLLIEAAFQHAFPDGHPIGRDPIGCTSKMGPEAYFKHIDALAERLRLASYVASTSVEVDVDDPTAGTGLRSDNAMVSVALPTSLRGLLRKVSLESARISTNLIGTIKPGYSALIPTVAIVFYARMRLGTER